MNSSSLSKTSNTYQLTFQKDKDVENPDQTIFGISKESLLAHASLEKQSVPKGINTCCKTEFKTEFYLPEFIQPRSTAEKKNTEHFIQRRYGAFYWWKDKAPTVLGRNIIAICASKTFLLTSTKRKKRQEEISVFFSYFHLAACTLPSPERLRVQAVAGERFIS